MNSIKTQIKAEIVADSINQQGDRWTSLLITFPRIILSEVNTHRMLSKNTSSSRAIPFLKMVESVRNNPFIPIAWQKNHPGMQGTEYLSKTALFNLPEFVQIMSDTLNNMLDKTSKDYLKAKKDLEEKIYIIETYLKDYKVLRGTLDNWWLFARTKAVEAASILYVFGVTKQLCNRLLEPWMWTTMLISGSEEGWSKFFNLRNPQYVYIGEGDSIIFKSKKEFINHVKIVDPQAVKCYESLNIIKWLQLNEGHAEIHMMQLAERIYDAMQESVPKQLKAGEWHCPFSDKITDDNILSFLKEDGDGSWGQKDYDEIRVKISTAMAARTSYTVIGDEKDINYERMLQLHDELVSRTPPHSSPFEHCARAMSDDEYYTFVKGRIIEENKQEDGTCDSLNWVEASGWCNNAKGFIPYRYLIDNKLI